MFVECSSIIIIIITLVAVVALKLALNNWKASPIFPEFSNLVIAATTKTELKIVRQERFELHVFKNFILCTCSPLPIDLFFLFYSW